MNVRVFLQLTTVKICCNLSIEKTWYKYDKQVTIIYSTFLLSNPGSCFLSFLRSTMQGELFISFDFKIPCFIARTLFNFQWLFNSRQIRVSTLQIRTHMPIASSRSLWTNYLYLSVVDPQWISAAVHIFHVSWFSLSWSFNSIFWSSCS